MEASEVLTTQLQQWTDFLAALWSEHGFLIGLGVGVFIAIVVALTTLISIAQAFLVPKGEAKILINDDRELEVPMGNKLLQALAAQGIQLPSACGGKGMCGECRAIIEEGAGPPLPTERDNLGRAMIRQGYRLTCQVKVKDDIEMVIPPEILGTHTWKATVRSNRNLTPLIKEPVLDLPEPAMRFKAGQYLLLEVPPHRLAFRDFDIDEAFHEEWDGFDWWRYDSRLKQATTRSYSMANYPEEGNIAILNVRLALPPKDRPGISPGKVSSYVFSLKPEQKIKVSGPYGDFNVREGDGEMIFVGGGAGMAPLRSMILDQLERVKTRREMSYWYGARGLRELFYADLFEELAEQHDNFSWQVALSEPRPEDHWDGPTGFIHQVLFDRYLKDHPAPEDCDYYLCGPPPMLKALLKMLDELGVDEENIFFDDFGG